MPEADYRHIRVRSPDLFSRFRVISRMSHLDPFDQELVRRRVPRNKRPHAKYTVGKLKEKYGKQLKITGRSWKLQKIMVKR